MRAACLRSSQEQQPLWQLSSSEAGHLPAGVLAALTKSATTMPYTAALVS